MNERSNPNNETEPDKNDSDWNEVSFGKLLGFQDENQPPKDEGTTSIQGSNSEEVKNQADATNPIATHELFDSPHEGKTQPNFYSNPFATSYYLRCKIPHSPSLSSPSLAYRNSEVNSRDSCCGGSIGRNPGRSAHKWVR